VLQALEQALALVAEHIEVQEQEQVQELVVVAVVEDNEVLMVQELVVVVAAVEGIEGWKRQGKKAVEAGLAFEGQPCGQGEVGEASF